MIAVQPNPYLIGIAGPSCAGKTELARRLAEQLEAPILPLDAYYFNLAHLPLTTRAGHNFDLPSSLDHDLFAAHVAALAEGQSVGRPIYDFVTHSRTAGTELVPPARFIIIEGLFVLYWEDVRRLLGTGVFVDLDDRACLDRRILRDVRERGRTAESVIMQFAETVRPMCEQYIRPTDALADVVVRGNDSIDHSLAAVLAHIEGQSSRPRAAQP